MARYRLWFHDKDKEGEPLDKDVLKTAEEIAPFLTTYRYEEIDSKSICNEIMQEAVEAASRAVRRHPIANLAGYIARIYKRIVDLFVDHKHKVVPVDDDFLETLVNTQYYAPSFEDWMHNRLDLEKLEDCIDPETRQIWDWRKEGYTQAEIAKQLGTTENAISMRVIRAFRAAAKDLLRRRRRSKGR
jgi:DNA-directed RNA polymerase specialized sigma24 family protein